MNKIDRPGWTAGIVFQAFGLRVGLRVNDPSILESFLSRVPACWTRLESAVVDRMYSVITPIAPRPNFRRFSVLLDITPDSAEPSVWGPAESSVVWQGSVRDIH